MALGVAEICFEPAKTGKNLDFFGTHFWHWFCAQKWFRRNWRRVVAATFFSSVIGVVASVNELSFFSYVSNFRLKFSRFALWRKRLQLDSKNYLTMNGLILGFFVRKWLLSLTSYRYGLKWARIAQLFSFVMTSNFFDFKVEGFSGLFYKNACTF